MRRWGEDLWATRGVGKLLPGVVRRALAGANVHPRWLPRRALTVVAADVDTSGGVGAVWVAFRPKSARAREYTLLLEWYDQRWRRVGGGIGPMDDPGEPEVLAVRGGGGVLSLTRREDPPGSIVTAPWIGCTPVHVGQGVGHLLIGSRRFDAPLSRRLIAAWKSPQAARLARPVVVALAPDGTELSRIGPYDALDTHTWARLREEL